jgi:hypothetical protein
MRAVLPFVVIFASFANGALGDEVESACKNSSKLIGQCFTVHGRLSLWNGTPGVRIWRVGTKRIIGVFDASGEEDGGDAVPRSVAKLLAPDPYRTDVYGDYEVCPFDRERLGVMQNVCIAETSHLVSRER